MIYLHWFCQLLASGSSIRRQRGATLIEYVLIVAVLAVAVFATSQTELVAAITGVFSEAKTAIEN